MMTLGSVTTRTPASVLGRPVISSPVFISETDSSIRTVPASRSRLRLRRAASAPQRMLPKVASRTRARHRGGPADARAEASGAVHTGRPLTPAHAAESGEQDQGAEPGRYGRRQREDFWHGQHRTLVRPLHPGILDLARVFLDHLVFDGGVEDAAKQPVCLGDG